MIIPCKKCNKKFNVVDHLIPKEGRLLECSSCSHQWHFIPGLEENLSQKPEVKKKPSTPTEDVIKDENTNNIYEENKTKKEKQEVEISISPSKSLLGHQSNENLPKKINLKKKQNLNPINYFNLFFVLIITLIAIVIVLDTFSNIFSLFIPNLEFYLNSLREIFKDIYLFFSDLF